MFEQTFKNIDDVLWKEAGCATELDYTEQTSWILFLKYLDDLERANEQKGELQSKKYEYIIDKPHRWSAWAAPKKRDGGLALWPVELGNGATVDVAVVSMGNPHAVQLVADVERAPVAEQGALLERHARFARGVNAGFVQVVARDQARLRVWERGAGETLACGTGACAAVAVGMRLGVFAPKVDVATHGGVLTIEWAGDGAPVLMTGPAETAFEGEIEL